MSTPESRRDDGRPGLDRLWPLGGIVYAIAVLIAFFTSADYDSTPQAVVEYASENQSELWYSAILGLATPLFVGWFVAGLAAAVEPASRSLRNLVLVGGTTFVVLVTTGFTIWSAPLLDDDVSIATAEAYLALDDFGWVMLGAGGVGMGLAIIGSSLAALRLGWVPTWAGWLGVVLGVVAFASAAAVGLFAWIAFLVLGGLFMLLRGDRMRDTSGPATPGV